MLELVTNGWLDHLKVDEEGRECQAEGTALKTQKNETMAHLEWCACVCVCWVGLS